MYALSYCHLGFSSKDLPFLQSNGPSYQRPTHIGVQVPKDVFEQVESDYKIFIERSSDSLWRKLHKEYPKMPLADKREVHRIILSRDTDAARNPTMQRLELTVYRYVRDVYTPYESNRSLNEEEISEVHEKLRDIIASWRGDM